MYNQFSHLHKLPQLLESPNVDLRVAAGETIALFYELSRSNSQVRSAVLNAYIYLCKIVIFVRSAGERVSHSTPEQCCR